MRKLADLFSKDESPNRPKKRQSDPSVFSLFTRPGRRKKKFVSDAPPTTNNCAVEFREDKVFWAMRDMPIEEAVKNFLVCGMVGSGKTIAIRLFLQSIARRFMPDRKQPEQLIIFDAKSEILPILAGMGLTNDNPNFYILNPFDERSMIWNLGEAVQEPALARGFATLLAPEEAKSSAPFFASAARDLVNAVILGLNHTAGTNWTLRDLLCALDSKTIIKKVTSRHPRAKQMVQQLIGDRSHFHGVLSTLSTKLVPFHQTAALWHTSNSAKSFSIKDFLSKPGVLVLGNDTVLRDSLWPINAAMIRALTAEILRGPNYSTPRHWFILDEFRAMEKVDAMHDLLNRGRSKGASVVLGIQSTEGLMQVYQENGTHDILSQCTSKSFLRAGGPKTAQYASDVFGSIRWYESSVTQNFGKENSHSVQTSIADRPLLLPSYFLNIPFPGPAKPYTVVSDVPSDNTTYITKRPFDTVISWVKPAADTKQHPTLIARTSVSDQTLEPWSAEEMHLYCGPAKSKKRKSAEAESTNPAKPKAKPRQKSKKSNNKSGLAKRRNRRGGKNGQGPAQAM